MLVGVVIPARAASAIESMPDLQWGSAVDMQGRSYLAVTGPDSSITLPCQTGMDLVTYDSSGYVIRQIDQTSVIDGVENCIGIPVVDKNGDLYGIPYGELTGGGLGWGSNLLAYDDNSLKWKYPAICGSGDSTDYVVGGNGNIYVETSVNGDVRLIGLSPELGLGQTEPTVVLDLDIPDDCGALLRPYKEGIMIHGQSGGHARYYSYGGKYLGQATIGNIWNERMGADGHLFIPKFVYGLSTSIEIQMYDPRKGFEQWSVPVSTAGSDAQTVNIYPSPNGGVVAVVLEQKMSGGFPAIPEEYNYVLVVLDEHGQKVRSVTLPNEDSQGNMHGSPYVSVDESGKVAIVRSVAIPTQLTYPELVPGIFVGVYDPATNSWVYQDVMAGDLGKDGGPNGYQYTSWEWDVVTMAEETLFVMANCMHNCDAYGRKLYALEVSGLGMDYPRAAVLNANTGDQPAPLSYVALGDSFSSGAGVNPYVDEALCLRSSRAYPKLLGMDPDVALQLNQFVACSGARTEQILDDWNADGHNEAAQVDALSEGSAIVTVTVGGNDIGFVNFTQACVLGDCHVGTDAYQLTKDRIFNDLSEYLESVYLEILSITAASEAEIYVLGYPQVVADPANLQGYDPRCLYLFDTDLNKASILGYPWTDAYAARDIVTRLNNEIELTVDAVRLLGSGNERLRFVSATGADSPFNGHEVCGASDSYFFNLDQIPEKPSVFHPNEKGQRAYFELALAVMDE